MINVSPLPIQFRVGIGKLYLIPLLLFVETSVQEEPCLSEIADIFIWSTEFGGKGR